MSRQLEIDEELQGAARHHHPGTIEQRGSVPGRREPGGQRPHQLLEPVGIVDADHFC